MNKFLHLTAFSLLLLLILTLLIPVIPVLAARQYANTYVNTITGSDYYSGTSPTYQGGNIGPTKTIECAINRTEEDGTVHVAAGTYTETVHLSDDMNLIGDGALSTIINANGQGCALEISSAPYQTNTITGFTIKGGSPYNGNPGGGVYISSSHIVTINDCAIIDNRKGTGLVQVQRKGAGICNDRGKVYLYRCTISGNTADEDGGGIANICDIDSEEFGRMYLSNCTISGNTATDSGGGLYNGSEARMVLQNATIANNQCTGGKSKGGGFAVASSSSVFFMNCLVANNIAGYSQFGNGYSESDSGARSDGYNLDSQDSCYFHRPGDMINTNPLLGALQNNGGPTSTMSISTASPAYNHADRSGAPDTDQRGVSRILSCSIGAYEPNDTRSTSTNTSIGNVTFNINIGSISNVTWVAPVDIRCSNPAGYNLPYGMFSFNISNLTAGSSVQVTLKFPNPIPLGTKYYKCINGNIIDCTSLLTRVNEYTSILTLTDGGLGDADGVANGTIVDPGGPAFPLNTPHSSSAQMSVTAPQKPVSLSNISVKSASLSATKVTPGTPVTVTASVANTGTGNGSSVIKVYVNGAEDSQQGVTVNSGSTSTVSFDVARNEPGTYTVYVGGTQAGSFTVDQFTPDTILFISGALVFFSLVLGVIYMTRRRA